MNNRQKNLLTNILLPVGVVAALFFWIYLLFGPTPGTSDNQKVASTAVTESTFGYPYQSALDGTGVDTEEEIHPSVVSIMIDNHPDARPSVGLSKARVVYEAPVEGAYTRFMALYTQSDSVEAVGPVRSARPYFIRWAEEYGYPMYFHSGGSPDGLALLAATSTAVNDFNEFWNGQYFWRADDRYAPHDLLTKSEKWQQWYQREFPEIPADHGVKQSWNFVTSKKIIEPLGTASTTLSIPFALDYRVVWEYHATTSRYTRFENNRPRLDEDGSGITAATVIVQFVKIKVLDNYGRLAVEQMGNGEALVYTAGRVIKGTWNKVGTNRTRWYDSLGGEIPLMYGTTWIEVVPR